MKILSMLLCIFSFACFALPGHAQDKKPAGKGIDPAIVAAYEEFGATYGGFVGLQKPIIILPGKDAAEGGLPGFLFLDEPKGKLPDAGVPFGLMLLVMTDARLKGLADLKNLTVLDLNNTNVSDAGLKEQAGLRNLTTLNLRGTQLTDAGLKELASLQKVITLNLSRTRLTDAGLRELASLQNLATIDLGRTQVTDAGVAQLQKALPKCQIVR